MMFLRLLYELPVNCHLSHGSSPSSAEASRRAIRALVSIIASGAY
jgi:hypothetical protein